MLWWNESCYWCVHKQKAQRGPNAASMLSGIEIYMFCLVRLAGAQNDTVDGPKFTPIRCIFTPLRSRNYTVTASYLHRPRCQDAPRT